MTHRGVVAAGHPLTAEAGARVLREGGNAVDAAVAAVLSSFSAESALTGLGAGGFMAIGGAGVEPILLDFFVAAPGLGGERVSQELVPVPVHFDERTTQVFNAGAVSCGVPGTAAGLTMALERYGSAPLADLAAPAARQAREGAALNRQQAYVLRILEPIYTATPAGRAIFAPRGRILGEGEVLRDPALGDALERLGEEGPDSVYQGETAARIESYILERGGTLSRADLAAYRVAVREPVAATVAGYRVLTNPPPSAGGILIAYSLAVLERLGGSGTVAVARAMQAANEARGDEFAERLGQPGFEAELLGPARLEHGLTVAQRLGSTTHLAALDRDGLCATVTCSNGTGSGMIVPDTGVHLNNMLGEEDLNPLGFHQLPPGTRVSSMMAPTLVLDGTELRAGLGSAGSNRIRSAVLQTILNLLVNGMDPQAAVNAPRVHLEGGLLQAEPGVNETDLARIEAMGQSVFRWGERNLFFGGVQVVTRDLETGLVAGGGDPRRGGAVAYA